MAVRPLFDTCTATDHRALDPRALGRGNPASVDHSADRVKVRHLMTDRVLTVGENQSLPLAIDLMRRRRIRHLPVVDDEGGLVGLLTQRDALEGQVSSLTGLSPSEREDLQLRVRVADLMHREVWCVSKDASAVEALRLLTDHKYGCLPVVDPNRRVVGIITSSDFLQFAMKVLESNRR